MSTEYPKVIDVDGLKVTVSDEADEARFLAAKADASEPVAEPVPDPAPVADAPAPESDPSSPLDDVTVEMDNPDFAAKPTGKAAKKK